MSITLPTGPRTALADLLVDRLDAGAGPGVIEIRTAPRPAATDAATGTLLATFTLNDPAFGDAAAGVATLDITPSVTVAAVAAGNAAWFRAKDSNSVTVFDGLVTATGGGGDLTINSVAITNGLALEITSGTITQPDGT